MPKKLTTAKFINRANIIHKNKYDYTEVEYNGTEIKVKIICPTHGCIFSQTPHGHLNGETGCRKCSHEKKIKTNIKRRGVEYSLQSEDIKEKIKETNLRKYGVENPFQSEEIKFIKIQTMLENWGVKNPQQSNIIQNKTKQTMLNRHGVEYSLQSEKMKNKFKQTNLEKYGVEFFAQKHLSKDILSKLNNTSWIINQHHLMKKPIVQIAKEIGVDPATVSRRCKKNNIDIKYYFQSYNEKLLESFIKQLGYGVLSNRHDIIPPYEIDIFIPDLNIALEYNGLYWHRNKGTEYHMNKTKLCKENGIHLIHVWEDKWINNQETVKEEIVKIINNQPLQELNQYLTIDLSLEDYKIYEKIGYEVSKIFPPTLYSSDIWDCGTMSMIKKY